jgi:hypothetical protein
MPSKEAQKTLLEKLIEVALDVPYMSKAGKNEAQDYKYVSEAQVTAQLRDLLLKRGVLFYPNHRLAGNLIVNEKGRIVTTIESLWTFTDGTDTIVVQTIGQGADNGDKGAFKAMTGSKKYALLQALLIATGEDPEEGRSDEKEPTVDFATAGQKAQLAEDGKAVGMEGDSLRAFVVDVTQKQTSAELTKEDMVKLFEALKVLKATGGQVVTTE